MRPNEKRDYNGNPNEIDSGTAHDQGEIVTTAHQFGSDYVITGAGSAGEWLSCGRPIDVIAHNEPGRTA